MMFIHLSIFLSTRHVYIYVNLTEPGYYADGQWGIRIEDVVIVREVNPPNNFGGKGYLGFERLTMVCLCVLPVTHAPHLYYSAQSKQALSSCPY